MVRNRSIRPYLKVAALAVAAAMVAGCATGAAFRQGETAAHGEDWDSAVEYYRKAVQDDPRNAEYRVALHRAMINAAREHYARARALEETGALADAVREYRRAGELDPGNNDALYRVAELERAIRDRMEAARPRAPIEDMRDVARRETAPPLLEPASGEPLSLRFVDQSVQDILDFIGNATGVNINYDRQFQDLRYSVQLDGVTVEEALDQILMANQYFYKVLGPRNVIVAPDTPQKRQQYEDQVIRTFYISNADVLELSQLLTQIIRGGQPMPVQPQIVPNEVSNTITVRATPAVTAVIEQVIAANDKPRAEIIVDIEILEVNRERAREFGLDLGDYSIGAVFAPDADTGELSTAPDFGAPPLARAGDFFFSVPSAVVDFLESDAETRVVAKPQLRGQEGAVLTLNLGEEIPIPTTAFTPIAAGGATFNPLTSFDYRDVGVNVEMLPRVTFENEIILDLEVENSTLGPSLSVAGQSMPTFGSRKVETTLRLRDGESNLLAGLLREEDRRSLRGIPGLARLPIIRNLLSSNEDTIRQTDIIMLLTPRIVRTHQLTAGRRQPDPHRHAAQHRRHRPRYAGRTGACIRRRPAGGRKKRGDGRATAAACRPAHRRRAYRRPAAGRGAAGGDRALHRSALHQRRLAGLHSHPHAALRPGLAAGERGAGGELHAAGRRRRHVHAAGRPDRRPDRSRGHPPGRPGRRLRLRRAGGRRLRGAAPRVGDADTERPGTHAGRRAGGDQLHAGGCRHPLGAGISMSIFRRSHLRGSGAGYSFVELIVVSALLIVLASAAVPLATVTMQRQREVELRRALRELRTAIDRYKDAVDLGTISVPDRDIDAAGYPPDIETLVAGEPLAGNESDGRMRFLRRVPLDPMTRGREWGLRSYQDEPDARRWGGGNVYDVRSLSDGTALDGTRYRDW